MYQSCRPSELQVGWALQWQPSGLRASEHELWALVTWNLSVLQWERDKSLGPFSNRPASPLLERCGQLPQVLHPLPASLEALCQPPAQALTLCPYTAVSSRFIGCLSCVNMVFVIGGLSQAWPLEPKECYSALTQRPSV